jgi:hypothetical protein
MIFGKKGTNTDNPFITKIEGIPIDIVSKTKFLGIILDNALSWKQHLAYLSTKVAKSIGILNRARKFLDKLTLKTTLLLLSISVSDLLQNHLGQCCKQLPMAHL